MTSRRISLLATALLFLSVIAGATAGSWAASADANAAPATHAVRGTGEGDAVLPRPWGVYRSQSDEAYHAWTNATGTDKDLLAKIAMRSRLRWFGTHNSNSTVRDTVARYIAANQNGDPNTLVPFATFRLWMHGGEAGENNPITQADIDSYKQWVRRVIQGIGTARVVILVEPDLPVALGSDNTAKRLQLAHYATMMFSKVPTATVYLDAGDSDWLSVDKAVPMLKTAGLKFARGFALGATHYSTIKDNKAYAAKLISALDDAGIADKKAIIDTADNGQGFTWLQYHHKHPNGYFDNAETCTSTTETQCVTLGHPPTTNTGDPNIDAYLWYGRPWLYAQAYPFKLQRALAVARTTPYN